MAFRLSLLPTWSDVDLAELGPAAGRTVFAAVRPGSGRFTPSLAVTETRLPADVPMTRLLDRATGRSATAAASVQVLDTRQVGDGVLVRTVRAQQKPPSGPDDPRTPDVLLQYLVLVAGAPDAGGVAVVHLAVTIAEDQAGLIAAELEPMIGSLSVVAGPPGRLP